MPSQSLLSLIQPALFDAVGTPAYLIGGGGGMTRVGVAVTVGLAVGARVGVGSTKVAGSSLAGTAVGTRVAVGDPKHRMQKGSLETAAGIGSLAGCAAGG